MPSRLLPGLLVVAMGVTPTLAGADLAERGAPSGDNFRISNMGEDGDADIDALESALAYDPGLDEFLVVWAAESDEPPLVPRKFEIHGQRVAANGTELGAQIRISNSGADDDINAEARVPDVAFNGDADEYLVVWRGDPGVDPLANQEFEIFGQLLEAGTNAEIGPDFRISDMGPTGDEDFDADDPAVAYNPVSEEYLVVWSGDTEGVELRDQEFEIFGQRLSPNGVELGTDDFRISDMGPNRSSSFGAFLPDVAHDPIANVYLVVWEGDDDTGALVNGESEIFGQLLSGVDGSEIGGDRRFSDMGPDGSAAYDALSPALAYSSVEQEFLLVWHGDDNTPPLVNDELEVFGQRIDAATGNEVGGDFRISSMGPDGSTAYGGMRAAVTYSAAANEYLVVWDGDQAIPGPGEIEVYGRTVDAETGDLTDVETRISIMGVDGQTEYEGRQPATAAGTEGFLTVWEGDDGIITAGGELEIFGQVFSTDAIFNDGFETGDPFRWTTNVGYP